MRHGESDFYRIRENVYRSEIIITINANIPERLSDVIHIRNVNLLGVGIDFFYIDFTLILKASSQSRIPAMNILLFQPLGETLCIKNHQHFSKYNFSAVVKCKRVIYILLYFF